MNKLNCVIAIAFCSVFIWSVSAEAQDISVGGGVGYGSKSENVNFQVNMYYRLPDMPIRVGAEAAYSVPEKNAESRVDQIEGNINGHYMVVEEEQFSLYGLTGLNILHNRFKYEPDGGPSISESDTNLGLNIGTGAELDIGFGRTFGEAKYILGRDDVSQLVLGAGVRVDI